MLEDSYVGHGFGCEVLWVQWLEYVMGWPAPSVVERWVGCSVGEEMDVLNLCLTLKSMIRLITIYEDCLLV
jgi:hypothetical protein